MPYKLITDKTAKLIRDDANPNQPKARGQQPPGHSGMNKTEARYAAELQLRKRAGKIAEWWWEPWKVRLAKRTTYTVDFAILHLNGQIECVEIKGFLRDDASIKFKLAREKFFLFKWTMLSWKHGQWEERLK